MFFNRFDSMNSGFFQGKKIDEFGWKAATEFNGEERESDGFLFDRIKFN